MKIALIGYGKMGKIIEEMALERGHTIGLKISSTNLNDLTVENLKQNDVAIEFSNPESSIKNIQLCFDAKVPVAVGTTGWYNRYNEIAKNCTKMNACLLTATNFSVGVNLFFELNKQLAKLMSPQKEYVAEMEEIHHTEKLDSPSGTAITLAEQLIDNHSNYKNWKNEPTTNSTTLSIISERLPQVPGTHTVSYSSEVDSVSITHTAKNRKGFALGAVIAAEFIYNKTGIYKMNDVLNQ